MKKSLLALAVLAASGAAFAQSSVTLYGRVDLGISKTTGGTVAMADGSAVGGGASRIGLRGTEDLGGGLKAGFLVETGVSADANTAVTQFGNRNSYIDLTGSFGGIRLGRQLNPALFFAGTYSAFGTDYGQASSSNILAIEGARYNNSIAYMGAFGPVSVMFHTAMKEGDTFAAAGVNNTGSAVADSKVGAAVGAVGASKMPLSLGVNYNASGIGAGLTLTKDGRAGSKLLTQIGGSYDAKVVKVALAYEQDKNIASGGNSAYLLSATAPVGAAKILFQYGKKDRTADVTQTALGATYSLSKRTGVYGVVAQLKTAGSAAKTQTTLGLAHTF